MKLLFDLHTHTVASGHAFSTLKENIEEAAAKGLKAMGTSDADVTYGTLCMQPQKQTEQFRYHYGWYPKENVKNAFTDWYIKYQSQTQKQSRRKTLRNIKMDKKWKERILYTVECVLLFALCEFLTYDTRDMQLLDFADFRLFFVTIVGMMYGLRFGVAASVAACVMYFASSGNQTTGRYSSIIL